VYAEIIAAAAGYEQSNRTQLRWERQFGYAPAQN
jgi:transcriptional regulator GlxA family with amidase domain